MSTDWRVDELGAGEVDRVLAAGRLFDTSPQREWTQEFLDDRRHHLWFAVDGGSDVGFVSAVEMIHPDKGRELFIYELGVAETHRRRGVGRALVEAVDRLAASRGCHGVWVATEPDNTAARATYRAAGYDDPEPSLVFVRDSDPSS